MKFHFELVNLSLSLGSYRSMYLMHYELMFFFFAKCMGFILSLKVGGNGVSDITRKYSKIHGVGTVHLYIEYVGRT